MSLIASCAPPSGVPEMLMLNFRGMLQRSSSRADLLLEPFEQRERVDHLVGVLAGDRTARDVPHRVAARRPGGHADRFELLPDLGTSSSLIQWSWTDWRVVRSIQLSPNSGFDTGPDA